MDLALSVLTQLLLAAPAEHHASRAPPLHSHSASQSPQQPQHCAASAAYVSSASAALVTQRLRELATAELQTSYLLLAHQLKRLMPKEVKVCIALCIPIENKILLASCEVALILLILYICVNRGD